MNASVIRAEGVGKSYRRVLGRHSVRALDGFSIDVPPGEVFGLLGPNGAGKTTFIKMLLGLVRPTEGRVMLFGEPAGHPASRARVGFLPEQHRFPGHLTARGVLDLYGRLHGLSGISKSADELLGRVGLAGWEDVRVKKFSKGMMQRLGLAQSLLADPDLIVLDEPTDGVDPVGRRDIRDLLLWLRARGTTVFLNSHLLSEVERVCNRVAILDKGKLVRLGTVAELTQVEQAFDLRCTPISDALRLKIGLDEMPVEGGLATYRVRVSSRAALAPVLQELLAAEVEIDAVQPSRITLEEYFLHLVGDDAHGTD